MKMKNFISCVIAILALSLTSCDDGGDNNPDVCNDCGDDPPVVCEGDDCDDDPPDSWFDMSLQPENLEKTIWQLIEVSINKEGRLFEHIELSEENIVYDFQGSDKLVISGNTAYLSVFDNLGLPISDFFKNGEHVYNYRKLEECPTCYPGPDPNLIIDNRDDPWAWHYCLVSLDNGRMEITGGALINIGVSVDNFVFYQWEKTFILLSN